MRELVGASQLSAHLAAQPGAAQAAAYHLGSGGQRVRGRLALSAGLVLGLSKHDVLCIAAASELLHNASLVHDDLQDRDALRHARPAVWAKFGANVAVCTGDLMLSAAYAGLCGISNVNALPALLALVHGCVASAIEGQCADLGVAAQGMSDIAAYERVAHAKSGALLGLSLGLALLASGQGAHVLLARKAALAFSVGYQVVDDLDDVQRDTESGALNVMSVLRRAGYGAGAHAQAVRFGLERLDRAVDLANELPFESGALLVELSLKLRLLLLVKND
jgi:geranylgeranyl pyrophosphate synthase